MDDLRILTVDTAGDTLQIMSSSTATGTSLGPISTAGPSAFGTTIVGKNQDATCYVGNLEERVTDSIIWELFLQVAPVVSLHIPRDRLNQTHYGYGFVELQSEADAEYASKILHGVKLYGKPLKVNKASADRKNLDVGANLFVGNLDPMVDDTMLLETFKSFGNVISAKVAREGEGGTGLSRGFGFVSFDAFEAADMAIESMSGQFLCNRPITVSYAFKKDGKGERHGAAAERLLAAQAKKAVVGNAATGPASVNGYRPAGFVQMMPQAGFPMPMMTMPPGYPPQAAFDPNFAAMMMMQQQQQQQQLQSQASGQTAQDYYVQYQQQYAQYAHQYQQQQQQQQYPPNQ